METLNEIADAVHSNAVEKGFHPLDEPIETFLANQCNNMHGEIQELWDSVRSGTREQQCDKPVPLSCQAEELADIIIRALDVSRRLHLDILGAIQIKHGYNTTRPYKHNKKN
jgi:hypothetical protein